MLAGVPEPVTVRAPAKINLMLQVGRRRSDGYHELATVFHALSLYDEVTATPATSLRISVAGEDADRVPADETNLAHRAAAALRAHAATAVAAALEIRKAIPVAGGMAGGSADAAAALVACDALWGTEVGREELSGLAAGLGSDVAFALRGGTALGTGRGEVLTDVLGRGSYHWVLALADGGGLSTPEVYATFDRLGIRSGPGPEAVLAALRADDVDALGAALHNDLQPAAVAMRPGLRKALEAAADIGAAGALVSGSGPSVALLARSRQHARDLAAELAGMGVCRAVRVARGPVAGARIVEAQSGP